MEHVFYGGIINAKNNGGIGMREIIYKWSIIVMFQLITSYFFKQLFNASFASYLELRNMNYREAFNLIWLIILIKTLVISFSIVKDDE